VGLINEAAYQAPKDAKTTKVTKVMREILRVLFTLAF
jgi:hypothetical protein